MRMTSVLLFVLFTSALSARTTFAQDTPEFPYDGVVTGDEVYVRSGDGTNNYATTKLYRGDRVRVLGEKHGWLRIVPPPGSFSCVDMTMVEKTGPKEGVVKLDGVLVRVGSTLTERRQTEQGKLAKGAKVTIVGEAGGFYKILPPEGAFLWITKQYVRPASQAGGIAPSTARPSTRPATAAHDEDAAAPSRVEEPGPINGRPTQTMPATEQARPTRERSTELPVTPAAPAGKTQPGTARRPAGPRVEVKTSEPAAGPRIAPYLRDGGKYASRMASLETELRTVLTRDRLNKGDVERLLKQYQELAAQSEEPIVQEVAKARATQLKGRLDLLQARDTILADRADLEYYRKRLGDDRKRIMEVHEGEAARRGFDFKGELRASQVFGPDMRRYRLVDGTGTGRTLAYVEIPQELHENIGEWIGQYVGIRTARREYDPAVGVPVVVAADISPLSGLTSTQPAEPSEPAHGVADKSVKPSQESEQPPDILDEDQKD